jgi:hypothetical protein
MPFLRARGEFHVNRKENLGLVKTKEKEDRYKRKD